MFLKTPQSLTTNSFSIVQPEIKGLLKKPIPVISMKRKFSQTLLTSCPSTVFLPSKEEKLL